MCDEGWIWIHDGTLEAWSLLDQDTFTEGPLTLTPTNPPPTSTQVYALDD